MDLDSTRQSCPICCAAFSILSVISSDTSMALAPGYWVTTWACLMVNSGSSSRGSLKNEMIPAATTTAVTVSVTTFLRMEYSAMFIVCGRRSA